MMGFQRKINDVQDQFLRKDFLSMGKHKTCMFRLSYLRKDNCNFVCQESYVCYDQIKHNK